MSAALTLVIDTATAACSIALIADRKIVAEAHEIVGRGHAERLVPMIAALPDGGRAARVLVDCGPGSFTGVRVGIAAARALAFGWTAQAAGYPSLALIAAAALAEDAALDSVAVAITGGHGELFVQRFGRGVVAIGDLASLSPAAAAGVIPDALVLGSGAEALVSARGHGEARDRLPRAADARLLPPACATLPASPIYGRPPDAKPAA